MKILVVKLSALGDVVQSLPFAMAVYRQAPQTQLDWLVERPSAGLLMGHPALSKVLVSPRHELAEADGLPVGPLKGFWQELRNTRYDVVVDLQGLMKSAILVRLSRAERKIGFRGGKEPLAALAYSENLAPYDRDRHALERYLDLLEPLSLERPARIEYGLHASGEETAKVESLLGGMDQRSLVVLHPMAKWDSKLWPLKHWAALAQLLSGAGLRLAITGSSDDRKIGRILTEHLGLGDGLVDLTGRTSLRELAALLAMARVVVSTDTGAMHLAAAMGTPVVALFGPTAPWRTGPYGPGHRVMRLGLDCSPCFERFCAEPRCMEELSPQAAADAAVELLTKRDISAAGPSVMIPREQI